MVSARSAAMGFNRLVDARFDALNPRTAMRELPRGAMSRREAALFVVVVVGRVRLRRLAAEHAVPRAGAGRAGDRLLVLAGQARTPPTRRCSSAWRWRWRRSAAGLRPAAAAARAVAARPGDRPVGRRLRHPLRLPGRRVRSRPRAALDSRRASASRAAIRLSRVMHVATVVAMAALWRVADLPALYLGGRGDRRACCSSTSSRSSATTICRR